MIILAHRGLWKNYNEQNTISSCIDSLKNGFGFETDVRDFKNDLLISHNPPLGEESKFEDLLKCMPKTNLPIAVNIKSDGLASRISLACKNYGVDNYFLFDMSIPDMKIHLETDNIVFARLSEEEKLIPWKDKIAGIWLDSFYSEWWSSVELEYLLSLYSVSIVSPELHFRDHVNQWKKLLPFASEKNLYLCTDKPFEAQKFFKL